MLILIDLDKTLIDTTYRTTDDGIVSVIQRAQRNGHVIGLSSDSSLQTLGAWRERLGMRGPVLAERGAVYQQQLQEPMPTGSADQGDFDLLRSFFVAHLKTQEFDVILCDPSEMIRDRQIGQKTSATALVNAFRRWSFHASFLNDTNAIQKATMIFEEARRGLKWHSDNFDLDANPEYNLFIVHDQRSRKAFGMKKLMSDLNVERAVVIGDGANDYTGLSGVDHWAVGNATEAYKKQCERIAHATYTSGVAELLTSF